jgi:hypothetical protein
MLSFGREGAPFLDEVSHSLWPLTLRSDRGHSFQWRSHSLERVLRDVITDDGMSKYDPSRFNDVMLTFEYAGTTSKKNFEEVWNSNFSQTTKEFNKIWTVGYNEEPSLLTHVQDICSKESYRDLSA